MVRQWSEGEASISGSREHIFGVRKAFVMENIKISFFTWNEGLITDDEVLPK